LFDEIAVWATWVNMSFALRSLFSAIEAVLRQDYGRYATVKKLIVCYNSLKDNVLLVVVAESQLFN
jgi:hypothetical protein